MLYIDISLGPKCLPGVLSVIAGNIDVISFLGLDGLFTAHTVHGGYDDQHYASC
jgi:hypothetical protein